MNEPSKPSSGRRLVVIDGANAIYRAFFALPSSLCASDGTPTNAILGFANMLTDAGTDPSTDDFVVST